MVLYRLVDFGMDSWNFVKGLVMRSSKPLLQVFVELFWMDSMLVFYVGWNRRDLWKKGE